MAPAMGTWLLATTGQWYPLYAMAAGIHVFAGCFFALCASDTPARKLVSTQANPFLRPFWCFLGLFSERVHVVTALRGWEGRCGIGVRAQKRHDGPAH